ncbi:mechanosensitive ion channel domain-containing protein [Marinomonas profundimaris]|uniref:Small-conductance mechanosensitive channel n=1 Tax=Marinomonas profundimaris TaxID=1208321 RepID=W1RTE8_9GAMM|nr:mechanosensitive ion channel domain-containing protein [Marinomonas profundimaris]ETI60267.1 Small-conductance mechanosensitive channel [Marinomonas profundimaris]
MMVQLGLITLLLVAYVILSRFLKSSVALLGRSKSVNEVRITYVSRMLNLGFTAVFVLLVCLVLGIGYGQLAIFFSSVFAVVGVALFAQWSILSNITASLIIFFGFPYRVGDWVKVVDKDDEILGQILEISTFHVIIQRLSGDVVTYPNSLILQKAVVRFDNKEAAQAMSQFKTEKEEAEKVKVEKGASLHN